VLAETDRIKAEMTKKGRSETLSVTAPAPPPAPKPNTCPSCGAVFEKALKFCGECGKPMAVAK